MDQGADDICRGCKRLTTIGRPLRGRADRHSQIYLTWIWSIDCQMAGLISRMEGEVIFIRSAALAIRPDGRCFTVRWISSVDLW